MKKHYFHIDVKSSMVIPEEDYKKTDEAERHEHIIGIRKEVERWFKTNMEDGAKIDVEVKIVETEEE